MLLPLALVLIVASGSPGTKEPGPAAKPTPTAPTTATATALVVVGDGLSAREMTAAETALRAATRSLTLLDSTTTAERLDAAGSRGFACALRSVDCLVQVGVICGVEQVLLADLSVGKVSLLLVDVNEGVATRSASVAALDPVAALAALNEPAAVAAAAALIPKEPVAVVAPPAPVVAAVAPVVVPVEKSPVPLIGGIVGGVLVAAGAVTAGVGSISWLTAGDSADKLALLEGQAADKGTDADYLDDVRAERARFDAANASWVSAGQPLVAAGAVAVGIGVGAAALSVAWLMTE